jgi:hypothetical protein
MTTHGPVTIVQVNVKQDATGYYASSPDIFGLNMRGDSFDALCECVVEGIKWLYKLNHQLDVDVVMAADPKTLQYEHKMFNRFVVAPVAMVA